MTSINYQSKYGLTSPNSPEEALKAINQAMKGIKVVNMSDPKPA